MAAKGRGVPDSEFLEAKLVNYSQKHRPPTAVKWFLEFVWLFESHTGRVGQVSRGHQSPKKVLQGFETIPQERGVYSPKGKHHPLWRPTHWENQRFRGLLGLVPFRPFGKHRPPPFFSRRGMRRGASRVFGRPAEAHATPLFSWRENRWKWQRRLHRQLRSPFLHPLAPWLSGSKLKAFIASCFAFCPSTLPQKPATVTGKKEQQLGCLEANKLPAPHNLFDQASKGGHFALSLCLSLLGFPDLGSGFPATSAWMLGGFFPELYSWWIIEVIRFPFELGHPGAKLDFSFSKRDLLAQGLGTSISPPCIRQRAKHIYILGRGSNVGLVFCFRTCEESLTLFFC